MPNVVVAGQITGSAGSSYNVTCDILNDDGKSIGMINLTTTEIPDGNTGEPVLWSTSFDVPQHLIASLKSVRIRVRGPDGFWVYTTRLYNNPYHTLGKTLTNLLSTLKYNLTAWDRGSACLLSTSFLGLFGWGGTIDATTGKITAPAGFPITGTASPIVIE